MTFRFALNLRMFAYTALYNLISRCRPFFSLLFFVVVPELFLLSRTFSNRERSLFYPNNFENGPLEPGYFLSWHFQTAALQSSTTVWIYHYFKQTLYTSLIIVSFDKLTDLHETFDYYFSFCIHFDQETVKGTERASPIYTLFHR